jgi:DNA-3-methyladenine glycosylase I
MVEYHDTEWGAPLHNDQKLFEFLVLDAFQAGLSWSTILHKRENFRKAFKGFDPKKVARFTQPDIQRLLADPGIIRNRLKIEATVKNAKAFLKVQKEHGTFGKYIWSFVGYQTVDKRWETVSQIPSSSVQSDDMSKDLKARGFSFVGTTICYAFMQAAGLVNDHLVSCFRHQEVKTLGNGARK